MTTCLAYDLGTIEYTEALRLQNRLVSAHIDGNGGDVILFLEHPSVLTVGIAGGEENIIVSREVLASEGVPVVRVDRGGDITYHGPGQLICYLILDLKTQGSDIHQYVRNLEDVVIRGLAEYSISANRSPKHPGVWVGENKICSLGIRVSRWISKHGFALNINTDLKYFTYINQCGLAEREVTSMSRLLGHDVSREAVITSLQEHCARVFGMNIRPEPVTGLGGYR
ncbi:MAG: lipoyl(octanoyl) transferase LipB [Chloroflexota bacterium]